MIIVSYITSLIATILGLCEPFGKRMKTILIFNFAGNLLVGVSYIFADSFNYSGAITCFTACIQVLINYLFDAKGKIIPSWVICIHLISFLAVNIISFRHWYDIIAVAAAMIFVVSVAQKNAKYYRVLYVTNSLLWIGYDFLSKSYGNLFTHVVLFIATTIAIIIRDKNQKVENAQKEDYA